MDCGLSEYHNAINSLFARTGTSRFGLERTYALLEMLDNPHRRFKSFHVAGTNGKGSVVATMCALLGARELRVGRYMSPHLVDFRERIVIGNNSITEAEVVDFLGRWGSDAEAIEATFFEITTAMAFDFFARSEVDVAVIETGLGGRLDATNVITPLAAGITSIAMDHQEYLGNTEREIAREKAGIFKPGIPSIIGRVSVEARRGIDELVQADGMRQVIEADLLFHPSEVRATREGTRFIVDHAGERRELMTGLVGEAQAGNTAVALAMLAAAGGEWSPSLDEAAAVLPRVSIPGRFQRVGSCILDVAHNPEGTRSLVATIASLKPPEPIVGVLGVLADKDWRGIMLALAECTSRIMLVAPPSAPENRAWDPSAAEEFARSQGIAARFEADFEGAIANAASGSGTAVITGSFHTVGDALVVLG
ncbi:MAG: Mur ligase family protein, partial [Gemmatimonadaceae bacterium]